LSQTGAPQKHVRRANIILATAYSCGTTESRADPAVEPLAFGEHRSFPIPSI
jgi:hypothetical protein